MPRCSMHVFFMIVFLPSGIARMNYEFVLFLFLSLLFIFFFLKEKWLNITMNYKISILKRVSYKVNIILGKIKYEEHYLLIIRKYRKLFKLIFSNALAVLLIDYFFLLQDEERNVKWITLEKYILLCNVI